MDAIILGIFSFSMVLICIVLVLFILMQKPNANAGMGASLGGGAAENAFGGEASNMLTKLTVRGVVFYFVLAFGLYLGYIYASGGTKVEDAKPSAVNIKVETPAKTEATNIEEVVTIENEQKSPVEADK